LNEKGLKNLLHVHFILLGDVGSNVVKTLYKGVVALFHGSFAFLYNREQEGISIGSLVIMV